MESDEQWLWNILYNKTIRERENVSSLVMDIIASSAVTLAHTAFYTNCYLLKCCISFDVTNFLDKI